MRSEVSVSIRAHDRPTREGLRRALGRTPVSEDREDELPQVIVVSSSYDFQACVADGLPVVVIIDELRLEEYSRAYRHGAAAVVHMDQPPETIDLVIECAANGEVVMPLQVLRSIIGVQQPAALTDEQAHLLSEIAAGKSVVGYAAENFMSERSARRRLQAACLALGASSRAEAIKSATELGLLS